MMSVARRVSGSRSPVMLFLGVLLAACLFSHVPAISQEGGPRRDRPKPIGADELHGLLDGLERGIVALKRLGRHDEVARLEKIANGLRRELRQEDQSRRVEGKGEREIARRQIEALKLAKVALREAGKEDAADLMHWAIRSREVMLEGRRDPEVKTIRERAPNREQTIEFLVIAEELYRKWGREDRAGSLSRMTEELWPKRRHPQRDEARRQVETMEMARRREEGREHLLHQIEVMEIARHGLLEAEKGDAADIMKRAIQVRKVELGEIRGEDADYIRRHAPGPEDQIEILGHAAKIWKEFGNHEKAEVVHRLAQQMKEHLTQRRGREGRDDSLGNRIEHLQRRLAELERTIGQMREELRGLRRTHY